MRVSVHGGSVARIVEEHIGVRVGGVRRRAELAARRRRGRRVQARAGNRPAHGAAPGELAGFNRGSASLPSARPPNARDRACVVRSRRACVWRARAASLSEEEEEEEEEEESGQREETTEEDARVGGW